MKTDQTPLDDATTTTHSSQPKILVVEDDTLILDMINIKLSAAGFDLRFVTDGSQATAAIKEFLPQVVVLDLMLPGKPGEEIIKDIKTDPTSSATEVIVFTNKNRTENEPILKALGATDYYVKADTDLDDLIKRISELTQQ